MALPPLTPEQRSAALAKAAEARKGRAEIKGKLKSGALSLDELIQAAGDDEIVGKMKVFAVLESMPGVGKVKAQKLMDRFEISATRRVRGLGARQRAALQAEFARDAS